MTAILVVLGIIAVIGAIVLLWGFILLADIRAGRSFWFSLLVILNGLLMTGVPIAIMVFLHYTYYT